MNYKLFLDDFRNPSDCAGYMHTIIGRDNIVYLQGKWIIARSAEEFDEILCNLGRPELVSLDHDLTQGHYEVPNDEWTPENYPRLEASLGKTGYWCAKSLIEYCKENEYKLPKVFIHTMNPAGRENIKNLLK